MVLLLALPIAIIDTVLLLKLMKPEVSSRSNPAELQRHINSSLIRFTFAVQLVTEVCTGSKVAGGIFSFLLSMAAGILSARDLSPNIISELLMNVFMGISMGIMLIGHLPLFIAILLITPALLSSGLAFLHTTQFAHRARK